MQYAEEAELLLEEMRRVLASLGPRSMEELYTPHLPKGRHHYPLSNALARSGKTAAFEEGPRAYALHHASVRHRLFSMFAQRHDAPAFVAMGSLRRRWQ